MSASPAPKLTRLRCPFCRYEWETYRRPYEIERCPNPALLPGDTADQRASGGRKCGAYLAGRLVNGVAVYPAPEVVT